MQRVSPRWGDDVASRTGMVMMMMMTMIVLIIITMMTRTMMVVIVVTWDEDGRGRSPAGTSLRG